MKPVSAVQSELNVSEKQLVERIIKLKEPPVARCRLLSRGLEPYHRLFIVDQEISGDKGCLACGNCVDSCPVLRREPERLQKTEQRTSMALESIVGEDCEQCYSCVLACPQVDTNIKDYIVDEVVTEGIPQLEKIRLLDNYFMVIAALIFGIIIGVFLTR
jgi:ferredoxin